MKREKKSPQIFEKVYEPPQNSRRQKGDIKQVLYWWPTNIWHHRSKFSRPDDLTTWRLCDFATWPPGDLATLRPGDLVTWRLGRLATWPPGDLATWRLGHLATCSPGDLFTWRLVHLVTWPPDGLATWRLGHLATWHRRRNRKFWLKFVFCIKFYMCVSFPFNNSNFPLWIMKRATCPQQGSSYSWDDILLSAPLFPSSLVKKFRCYLVTSSRSFVEYTTMRQ